MTWLLDTHILVYWLENAGRLSRRQIEILAEADRDNPLSVSDITLWEIATLYNLGRLRFGGDRPLKDWLETAVAPPLIQRIGISPAIAAEVAALPDSFHRDPADRIIVATARLQGATLRTQDRRIARSGLVATLQ